VDSDDYYLRTTGITVAWKSSRLINLIILDSILIILRLVNLYLPDVNRLDKPMVETLLLSTTTVLAIEMEFSALSGDDRPNKS
jgi:hypothetical protein